MKGIQTSIKQTPTLFGAASAVIQPTDFEKLSETGTENVFNRRCRSNLITERKSSSKSGLKSTRVSTQMNFDLQDDDVGYLRKHLCILQEIQGKFFLFSSVDEFHARFFTSQRQLEGLALARSVEKKRL